MMKALPKPRGRISALVFELLNGDPHGIPKQTASAVEQYESADATVDDDLQISLFVIYELLTEGVCAVATEWTQDAGLQHLKFTLEAKLEQALFHNQDVGSYPAQDVPRQLLEMASPLQPSPIGDYILDEATFEQIQELVVLRSVDNLHEADHHTWIIPRIHGRSKSALVEIQADEYGGGLLGRSHAELYHNLMSGLELDPTYAAYIEHIPANALAIVNIKALFGTNVRWRGAALGNLAVTEIGSSVINRKYYDGLRRVGASHSTAFFYYEHIAADAVHEQVAADMCGAFADDYPSETDIVLKGARATMAHRSRWSADLLETWSRRQSALRSPVGAVAAK